MEIKSPIPTIVLTVLLGALTSVGLVFCFFQLVEVLGIFTFFEFPYWNYSEEIYFTAAFVGFLLGGFWSRQNSRISGHVFLWCREFIAYWIAFSISNYGFAKILKTQFRVPEHIKDIAMGDQHPFWLTWYYFGFSYQFSLIIAASQIGGSILILFQRTRTLGCIVLFPVMVNILLINVFYQINFGAFLNSVFFLTGLVFFLLLDYQKLKECFLDFQASLRPVPSGKEWVNHIMRAFVILASFALIALYRSQSHASTNFTRGVWQVETISTKGRTVYPNQKDSVLTRLYFEHVNENSTILEFNDVAHRSYNSYEIDTVGNHLVIQVENKKMDLQVIRSDKENIELAGLYDGDSVLLKLKKIRDTSW